MLDRQNKNACHGNNNWKIALIFHFIPNNTFWSEGHGVLGTK